VLQPTATIELLLQDASGNTSALTLHGASSNTVATLGAAAEAVAPSVLALTGCALVGVRIKYRSEHALPVLVTGTPITNTGVFFFTTGTDTPDGGIVVHSLVSDVLQTDGPLAGVGVDLADSRVIEFADAVLSLPFSNPFGDPFEALFTAYLQSRV